MGKMFLEPGFRDFLFRFVQGRLHINQAIAAYNQEQEPYCPFCVIELNREYRLNGRDLNSIEYNTEKRQLPHENVKHLYWECNSTRVVIEKTIRILEKPNASASEYLIGNLGESRSKTEVGCIILHWSKYWIYGRKIDKRLIIMREFDIEFNIMLRKLQRVRKYRDIVGQMVMF